MIRDHWSHYRQLFGINESLFRNDYALSIALDIVNGHCGVPSTMPGAMCAIMPDAVISHTHDVDVFRVDYLDGHARHRYQILSQQDFHAMGKKHLGAIIDTVA